MTEHYVRPPLVPREAPAAWRSVWPFRLVALVAVLLLGLLVVALYQQLSGATSEDPGVGSLRPVPGASAPAR